MQTKRVLNVKTRLTKTAAPKITVLTLDYTGVTADELQGPAEDSLVIVWQGRKRRAKVIPSAETINVKAMLSTLGARTSTPATVEGITATAQTMTAEERAALIKKLQEMGKV